MSTRNAVLAGEDRRIVSREFAQLYRAGATIRDIAERTGRSYTGVRLLLLDAGIQFRPRGGGLRRH